MRVRRFMALALTLLLLTSLCTPVKAASGYTYTALDQSFMKVAADKILPQYRAYVLNAIHYHIESSTDISNMLKPLSGSTKYGNLIFYFDGVSTNLTGATYAFSGYMKNGSRYNTSAVCLVVRLNSSGQPEVVFAAEGSTIPDNVRDASLNSGTAVPITKDGIYPIRLFNHKGYAAFNIVVPSNSALRCSGDGGSKRATYVSKGEGIDIHTRKSEFSNTALSETDTASLGCFLVGKHSTKYDYTEYNSFIKITTGYSPARSTTSDACYNYSTPTSYGFYLYDTAGKVIIDRSNYATAMKTIYGNDSDFGISGGMTADGIVSTLLAASNTWHKAIAAMPTPSVLTYSVNYNLNGGSGSIAAQTTDLGKNTTVTSAVPTRSGYRFLGWSTSSTATNVTYASGSTYTGNATITLYAVWQPLGDVNGDMKLTLTDVSRLFQWWNGKLSLTSAQLSLGNCNGDSMTDLRDVAAIYSKIK